MSADWRRDRKRPVLNGGPHTAQGGGQSPTITSVRPKQTTHAKTDQLTNRIKGDWPERTHTAQRFAGGREVSSSIVKICTMGRKRASQRS